MKLRHFLFLLIITFSFSSCEDGCDDPPTDMDYDTYPAIILYPIDGYEGMGKCPSFIWDGNLQEDFDGSYRFTLELGLAGSSDRISFYVERDTIFHCPDTLEAETEYSCRVRTDASGDRIAFSGYRRFTTGTGFNNPPARPTLLYPPTSSSREVPLDVTLYWRGYDPDGDALTYAVWYRRDEDSDSTHISGLTDEEYTPPRLDADTKYFWSVIAEDEHSLTMTAHPTAYFYTVTTPPPHDPFPSDGAIDQPTDIVLSWSCTDPDGDDLTYDVEMGRAGYSMSTIAEGIAQDELPVVGLNEGVTYEWKVTAEDDDGHRTEGPVWTFTTIGGSDVIFADLTLNRRQTKSGIELVVIDNIWATFREGYTPPYSTYALRPDTVICGDIGLEWNDYLRRFYYENAHTLTFLVPGTEYEFSVAEGGGVRALTESILFPQCAPLITSPESYGSISLDGFTVTWSGYEEFADCDRQITITIEELGGVPTGVSVTTDNDGSYTFTAGELSVIDPMLMDLQIVLTVENIRNIDSPGYDPRSWIRARTQTVQSVYVD